VDFFWLTIEAGPPFFTFSLAAQRPVILLQLLGITRTDEKKA
jgi:hypothetical protein